MSAVPKATSSTGARITKSDAGLDPDCGVSGVEPVTLSGRWPFHPPAAAGGLGGPAVKQYRGPRPLICLSDKLHAAQISGRSAVPAKSVMRTSSAAACTMQ